MYKKPIIFIFLIAGILRIALSFVNFQANDNHFAVIKIIENENRLPTRDDGSECFQPKLYHLFVAAIFKACPFKNQRFQIRLAQFINCLMGMMTIYIVFLFLNSQPLTNKVRLICFSFVALNPKLIGINGQATNDSFVIFFATATIYFSYLFFTINSLKYFLYMTIFSIFAALSKGNGLVLFPAIFLIFSLKILKNTISTSEFKKNLLVCQLIFSFAYLIVVPLLGQYWHNYFRYDNPFVIGIDKSPALRSFKDGYVSRPGVTSIANSYFTFRFFDLIKHPTITNDPKVYPLHRTSLWSQLYGRTHFVFFDMWPPSWQTENPIILNIGRTIFVLALLPTLFLVFGVIKEVILWISAIAKCKFDFIQNSNDWIFGIYLFGYLSFIILHTFRYRDFSNMKAIYVFPALLSVIFLFSREIDRIYKVSRRLKIFLNSLFGLLLFFYFLSSAALIYKLLKYFSAGFLI